MMATTGFTVLSTEKWNDFYLSGFNTGMEVILFFPQIKIAYGDGYQYLQVIVISSGRGRL